MTSIITGSQLIGSLLCQQPMSSLLNIYLANVCGSWLQHTPETPQLQGRRLRGGRVPTTLISLKFVPALFLGKGVRIHFLKSQCE